MMQKSNPKKPLRPPQKQEKQGEEHRMIPKPVADNPAVQGCSKLENKIALITGGDSGIGKAVAVCDDSSYITGQVLHPNGGKIVNG